MAISQCLNVTSAEDNYSNPMPFIGLYTALASLLCCLLILCDLIHGIASKKYWLPCRLFRLNSVTLTLLSIATKIPFDLTTSMPSQQGQLSKLLGTTIISVSMVFLAPEVGDNTASETWTNMGALSIFVVTVIADICIQIHTGLIFSNFILGHVISMWWMLMLLLHLWISTWDVNFKKEISMDLNRDILRNGGSMLRRLKLCYLHGYNSNPQLLSFKHQYFILFSAFNLMGLSVTVLLLTILRQHSFFDNCSDYGGSVTIIILTQVAILIVVSIAVYIRATHAVSRLGFRYSEWRTVYSFLDQPMVTLITKNAPFLAFDGADTFDVVLLTLAYLWSLLSSPFTFSAFVIAGIFQSSVKLRGTWSSLKLYGSSFLRILQLLPFVIRLRICQLVVSIREDARQPSVEYEGIEEFRALLREHKMEMNEAVLKNCVRDVNKWMTVETDCLSHLNQLLSRTSPSYPSLHQLNDQFGSEKGKEVSCLYLVFLARIASISTPELSGCLTQSLNEVFDIIQFVDSKLNSSRFNNKKNCKFAKAMLVGKDFSIVLPKIQKGTTNEVRQSQSELDCALEIIGQLKTVLPSSFIWDEVCVIMDLISNRKYTSVQQLYDYMEQLFVDMLHIFLIQIPHAIFKEVTESHAEEYEHSVRHMLKLLWKIRSLEFKVQWSFPVGSDLTCLIEDDHQYV